MPNEEICDAASGSLDKELSVTIRINNMLIVVRN
jgi:hypothetical protein